MAAGFVTGMLSGVRARGIDPKPLLLAAGLPYACLAELDGRVPIANYAALYNIVVRHLDDEGFALFSSPLRLGTFEFLCRAVLGSRTLGEALDLAGRFLRLVLADLSVTISRKEPWARLEISERRPLQALRQDPRRVFAFEWLLRLLHGLACWLARRSLPLDEVRFPFGPPRHAADYALVYAERSIFGGGSLVARFDAALLDLPVRRDESDLAAFLDGAPGKITMLYRRDREMARAVRELLSGDLASAPSFEETARLLKLSPRTLHRHLHDEGSSFRAIKDGARREIALARLEKSRSSIAQIAAELGYSEPSAFFRAFQGWTGEAPSAHRKRHRGVG
ncbi:MAG: AraC family transcriptional regulator [Usitatibacter sp.]